MEDLFDLPKRAIAAFEAVTKLSVSIHDREETLWFFLPAERFKHQSPVCRAVKASGSERSCIQFDALDVHRHLSETGRGRIHVCPAGLVECVAPVFYKKRLEWVLFAGPRLPGPNLRVAAGSKASDVRPKQIASPSEMPRPIDNDEAHCYLELLSQLASRLQVWRAEIDPILNSKPLIASSPKCSGFSRRALILKFIHDHHRDDVSLHEIAEFLHLSESRVGHVVRDECGKTFIQLLQDVRLRSAALFLRYTDLPIAAVARQSGFRDMSHFHITFRRHFGITPHRYRQKAEYKTNANSATQDGKSAEFTTFSA